MDSLALPWLPEAGAGFADEVRALRREAVLDAARFRRLATARLNLQQLTTLARALPKDAARLPSGALRLRVLSNGTTDLLLPALAATAPRHGVWLSATAAPFGTHAQEALDPRSTTRTGDADVVLLALDHRAFDLQPTPGRAQDAEARVGAALDTLLGMAVALQRESGRLVILQTLAPTGDALFGNLDAQVPGTAAWMLDAFNRRLREHSASGQLLLDVAAIAGAVGHKRWHDAGLWNLGKIPFSQLAVPLYAEHVARLLMAARGKAKKCLVLDLDNTVWGGVIGDDGLTGIVLGQGSAVGEAHLAVQATALALRERGIVLAVSTKNEDATARMPFRDHPDMLLRESHIAAFQANWQDKATNLRAIAKTLNIGVDALVLLDDNPAERHQVRNELPEVGVPELPDQPEGFAQTLLAAGYFESVQFTAEDRDRAEQYQANAARSAMLDSATDLASHLASLQMQAHMAPFDDMSLARVAQLTNKTNQFNLTTRRRSEAEMAALQARHDAFTLYARLTDRFGDNGIIAVVVALPEGDRWHIDTWLMSCRVLNRGVEIATLNVLSRVARQRGIRQLVGRYLPTEKNVLVRDHYRLLGFTEVPVLPGESGTAWVLDVADHVPQATQIAITGPWSDEG